MDVSILTSKKIWDFLFLGILIIPFFFPSFFVRFQYFAIAIIITNLITNFSLKWKNGVMSGARREALMYNIFNEIYLIKNIIVYYQNILRDCRNRRLKSCLKRRWV